MQCQGLATVPPVGLVECLNAKRKVPQASSQSRATRAIEPEPGNESAREAARAPERLKARGQPTPTPENASVGVLCGRHVRAGSQGLARSISL